MGKHRENLSNRTGKRFNQGIKGNKDNPFEQNSPRDIFLKKKTF